MARNWNYIWILYAIVTFQAGAFFTLLDVVRGREVSRVSAVLFITFFVCLSLFLLDKGKNEQENM
jgi:hypothetical protein